MRSKLKALALVLVVGAPLLAPAVLVNPVFAADEVAPAATLDEALEQLLAEALEGSAEEVEAQLQQLIDANPEQANAIAVRARQLAPAGVADVVTNLTQTFVGNNIVAAPVGGDNTAGNNQQNNNQQNNNQANNSQQNNNQPNSTGGMFVLMMNNQVFALNTPNQNAYNNNAGIVFAQNLNLFQSPLTNTFLGSLLNNSPNFEACILGASVNVGPYGTTSMSISRGC